MRLKRKLYLLQYKILIDRFCVTLAVCCRSRSTKAAWLMLRSKFGKSFPRSRADVPENVRRRGSYLVDLEEKIVDGSLGEKESVFAVFN